MKISFIGGGNMAAALISGLAGKFTAAADIHVIDPNPATLEKLVQQFGVTAATEIDGRVAQADVIVLAVKPQHIRDVALHLQPHLTAQPVLSVAAGIRAADLSRWLGNYPAIVRSMPNMPALIGQGITGIFALPGVSPEQRTVANGIMQAVGSTVWVQDEAQIDAVTAISGSGPAYVFYFIEALQRAAQELGLSAEQGQQLALATFSGATQLATQSTEPIAALRERVTSKGGTTYAALCSMEASGIKDSIILAAKAAAKRSRELGEELGRD